jgi:hypothetical protein
MNLDVGNIYDLQRKKHANTVKAYADQMDSARALGMENHPAYQGLVQQAAHHTSEMFRYEKLHLDHELRTKYGIEPPE